MAVQHKLGPNETLQLLSLMLLFRGARLCGRVADVLIVGGDHVSGQHDVDDDHGGDRAFEVVPW